jgi:site-specific DNA-methyltransferase (adenine-specific)
MTYEIYPLDCRMAMRCCMAPDSVDSIVTDPPYDLISTVKQFGSPTAAPAQHGTDGVYARSSRGFMGQQWDGTGVAFDPETWREAYRVLKPGGYLLAFGGTRTYHRMVCAIEDAGFEIRDCIAWIYGSGFPKSHNAGNGWGTALKPAHEPIVVARKPLAKGCTVAANVLRYGTGAVNIDACRVEYDDLLTPAVTVAKNPGRTDDRTSSIYGDGGSQQVVDASGRWPANVMHDGSDEVLDAFPDATGAQSPVTGREPSSAMGGDVYNSGMTGRPAQAIRNDSGSAARFFYCAKASKADREDGNIHPTVKPTSLMRWLVRHVTPPGGTVFDPFMGSGSTGKAAALEGFDFIGCEMTEAYIPIAESRIDAAVNARLMSLEIKR